MYTWNVQLDKCSFWLLLLFDIFLFDFVGVVPAFDMNSDELSSMNLQLYLNAGNSWRQLAQYFFHETLLILESVFKTSSNNICYLNK